MGTTSTEAAKISFSWTTASVQWSDRTDESNGIVVTVMFNTFVFTQVGQLPEDQQQAQHLQEYPQEQIFRCGDNYRYVSRFCVLKHLEAHSFAEMHESVAFASDDFNRK